VVRYEEERNEEKIFLCKLISLIFSFLHRLTGKYWFDRLEAVVSFKVDSCLYRIGDMHQTAVYCTRVGVSAAERFYESLSAHRGLVFGVSVGVFTLAMYIVVYFRCCMNRK
jgi:hypothetical protein